MRAQARLTKKYPDEYAVLLREELAKEGLSPRKTMPPASAAIAAYKRHGSVWRAASELGVSQEWVAKQVRAAKSRRQS